MSVAYPNPSGYLPAREFRAGCRNHYTAIIVPKPVFLRMFEKVFPEAIRRQQKADTKLHLGGKLPL